MMVSGRKEKLLVVYIPKDQGRIEVTRAPEGYRYTVRDWRERRRG